MVREMVSIPPKLGQILVNLESFLDLTQHLKVIMYLSAIVLLCWLTGNFYSSSNGRAQQARRIGGPSSGGLSLSSVNSSLADREANSADSNRSQPPSRRSSLLAEPLPLAAGDNQPDEEMKAASGAKRSSRPTLSDRTRLNKTSPFQIAEPPNRLARARAISAKIVGLSADLSDPEESADAGQVKRMGSEGGGNPHSKNWFKQVCSSFVRILAGISRGANDGGEATLSERQRDKQLEMLAGKIDNWYNSGGIGGPTQTPTPTPNGTEAAQSEAAAKSDATAAGQVSDTNDSGGGGGGQVKPEPDATPKEPEDDVDRATSSGELNPEGGDLAAAAVVATKAGKVDGGLLDSPELSAASQERAKATASLNVKQFNQGNKAVNKNTGATNADESLVEDNQQQADEQPEMSGGSGNEKSAPEQQQLQLQLQSLATKSHSDKANALERMEAALIV